MERQLRLERSLRSPGSVPSSELWGREVYDARGIRLGTIDSVVRTNGRNKAIVIGNRRSPRSIFVELAAAAFDGDVVVVPWTRAGLPYGATARDPEPAVPHQG
jgi:sporulation protein YlmC with PRC-barrel domain